jgi:hypothetical protein
MPNQSCTVIFNGHGFYNTNTIIDPNNYNIIFPCKIKIPISNSHHNLILSSLSSDINNLTNLEMLISTQKVNINAQIGVKMSMIDCHIRYTYEHALKNAPDMNDVISLYDIDQNRFAEQNHILVDYNVLNRVNWNQNNTNGSFKINYDINQIRQDVLNAYQQNLVPQVNSTIELSRNNIVFLTPVAAQGETFSQTLSDLMIDILPKIKIPIKYTPAQQPMGQQPIPASVEVSNTVFLDDGTFLNNLQNLFQNAGPSDVYHEMTIAGDANIIWDACRDFVE